MQNAAAFAGPCRSGARTCTFVLGKPQLKRLTRRSFAQQRRSTRMAQRCESGSGKQLVALDFDGVVCDSCGESSLSAFKAAALQWPDIFDTPQASARKAELVEKMRAVRPVVETGYENIVQIRCLYEGVTTEDMLRNWHTLLPERMQRWQLQRAQLVELFGRVRDEWIEADLKGWLAPNRIYPGVANAVRESLQRNETYIVTTKQAHFTYLLLEQMAGVPFPEDRIFSQTVSGRPKTEVLKMLANKHADASRLVFVEDKLSTLEKVAQDPELEAWQLFLVDWGYNTPEERQRASEHPRITVVGVEQFACLLEPSLVANA